MNAFEAIDRAMTIMEENKALKADIAALRADKQRLIQDVMDAASAAQDDHEYMAGERDELREICDGMERGVIEVAAENVKLAQEVARLQAQLAEMWTPVVTNELSLATDNIEVDRKTNPPQTTWFQPV